MLWNTTIVHFFAQPLRRVFFGGLVLLSAALWWLGPARAPGYQPADLAAGPPVTAVHDLPDPVEVIAPPAGPSPQLELAPTFYNFGRIAPDQVVAHTFILRNRGGADLRIYRAYTTCECTRAQISATVIPPGKVALVQVEYDPRLHAAPGVTLRRGLIIESNDPKSPQQEVWVQVTIRGRP